MGAEPRKPIFRREQIIKLNRLLNMKYKPAEIAEEIGVSADTIYRSYLPAGAPHERDSKNNIWIVGTSFREWALDQIGHGKHKKNPIKDDQAWCLKCNQPVTIQNPKIKSMNRYISMMQGTCPVCGGKVNRAMASDGARRNRVKPTVKGKS